MIASPEPGSRSFILATTRAVVSRTVVNRSFSTASASIGENTLAGVPGFSESVKSGTYYTTRGKGEPSPLEFSTGHEEIR